MQPRTLKEFREHAVEVYPRECCALTLVHKGKEKYFRCENTATSPNEHFVLGASSYAEAEDLGEITAVCHSHPGTSARPSEGDKISCESTGLPWYIVSVMPDEEGVPKAGKVVQHVPSGYEPPLVGAVFCHGVSDCYSLIRRWYKRERNIDLPDFERHDEWWNDGHSNLYLDHFKEAGFESVGQYPELEVGDILLMEIRSDNQVPNHAAVYIGDGHILQHLYGRLSSRDVYGGWYREVTRLVVRRPK